jgi:uncharacterized coiled-coil protein SlyX
MKNPNITFTTILFALGFSALSPAPKAFGLSPAPDGGYPGANTAEGQNALASLDTSAGIYNTAVGIYSLLSLTEGKFCTAVGAGTLLSNAADENTATGAGALLTNTTGTQNTATGTFSLFNNTTGTGNVGNGFQALASNTTGTDNIALGVNAGSEVTTASDVICIGAGGNNVDNGCYIGQIFGATSSGGSAVFVDLTGRLATATSSRRFKDDIKPMGQTSEALFALKPVTFRYKKEIDPAGTLQFGLVAEEVEKVNPDLVVRDKEGKPYSVRYEQVNAMLLNEFLKEHKKVEAQQIKISQQQATITELESAVAQQQKRMEALSAQLKKEATQIQKVSTQVEVSRPGPQIVINNP